MHERLDERLEALFERFRRDGDVDAMGTLFDRTAPEVLRLALWFVRDPVEAEDLVQRTYLTVLESAATYDTARPLLPWILGILTNHVHRSRREATRKPDPRRLRLADEAGPLSPESEASWDEGLGQAVEALPDPHRQALILRFRHGLEPAEIAHLMRAPPATVRSWIHRGLERLRERWAGAPLPALLVGLPIGGGLDAVRANVLTQAAITASLTSTTTATLLGGLLVTKKAVTLSVALVAALLAMGGGYALFTGAFSRAEPEGGGPLIGRGGAGGKNSESAPQLEGRATLPSVATPAPPSPPAPPEPPGVVSNVHEPIPPGKGCVRGVVRFSDGTPLAHTPLALWGSSILVAETDGQGRFHIHGDWVADRNLYIQRAGPGGYRLGLGDVKMRPDDVVEVDLTIERGQDVEGLVVRASDGTPVAGAEVTLRRPESHSSNTQQAGFGFATTDEVGRWRFPYLPPARYTLEVRHAGFEPQLLDFELPTGTAPARVALAAARALLLHFTGLPADAAGTKVQLMLQNYHAGTGVDARGVLDADGMLRVDAPPAGSYHLVVFEGKHLPRIERDGVAITAEATQTITLAIPLGARVEGTLRGPDGAPLAATTLAIAGGPSVRTDEQGAFVVPYVESGSRIVTLHRDDAEVPLDAPVEVPDRGAVSVELRVPGGASLSGRILVAGVPRSGMAILRNPDSSGNSRQRAFARAGSNGFRIPFLPPGTYDLVLWCDEAESQVQRVTLGLGEERALGDVVLTPNSLVPVTLRFPPGATLPKRFALRLVDPPPSGSSGIGRSPRLDWDGKQKGTLKGLADGDCEVEVIAEGFAPRRVRLHVAPGMVEPVEIAFERL